MDPVHPLDPIGSRPSSASLLPPALLAFLLTLAVGSAWRSATSSTPPSRPFVPPMGERARVAQATDGDTLLLADGRRVRLLGLDAPETHNPNLRGPQPFGEAAAERLAALAAGREVLLEADRTDRDGYGRLLRHVWADGELLAGRLLEEGLAWPLSIPPDLAHREQLATAAARAQAARRGLWGLARPSPLAPFRQDGGPVEGGGR